MSLVTKAYVVPEKGSKLELREITLKPLTASQVEVQMQACGLCHTDIHMRDNDWGVSVFPMVPGHEGIGVVRAVGEGVTSHKVGDIVGIGWMRDSCRACTNCNVGRENICLKGYQGTYLGSAAGCWGKQDSSMGGCFAQVMRIEAKFAFHVPANLKPELAAPLMCGGGTMYETVLDYVKPGSAVGIVSIGGLGTAGIKLSKLSGGVVTAFSRTSAKKESALMAGASHFVNMNDPEEMKAAAGTMDVILDTCPVNQDIAPMMDLLKFNGLYCRLGLPKASDQGFSYNWIPLIFCQKKIVGSVVAGSARTNQVLQLASDNKDFILSNMPDWQILPMPFDQVNEAMDTLLAQKNKGWRIVLQW